MDNDVFKALADPTRREILHLLGKTELSAGDIAERFPTTKSTLSHHLAVLKQADLIACRRDGQQLFYSLNTTVMQDLLVWMWGCFGSEPQKGTP